VCVRLEIEIPNRRPGNQKCGFLDFATLGLTLRLSSLLFLSFFFCCCVVSARKERGTRVNNAADLHTNIFLRPS